ncbi:Basic leucine zipper 61 [Ananas comosus]|uniref:Basic leucine zipper 61 n=1 Tax=Ananas comosus TaxID=4615 RepID=A0A199UQM5_ANACO|nr:Basic leucine zipper 61 [Ananas comosus]
MAQLPPKIPCSMMTCSLNWPAAAAAAATTSAAALQPSWVDEFLDFSAAKRGAHRRSVSDSGPFLEAGPAAPAAEFYRLDDDQLMSMFSDDAGVPPPPMPMPMPMPQPPPSASSAPSTPSDHNSVSDDKAAAGAAECEEAQSQCEAEPAPAAAAAGPEPIMDPRRVKRILANRQSAQRSRVRKLQYIAELERSVTTLQTEVSALSPRVAFLDHQRSILSVGNSHLKQRIAALAQDKIFKDAHQEALKKEIERLRQVYHQQNLKKMSTPTSEPVVCTEKGLLS